MGPRGVIWLVVLLVGCTPAPTPLPVQPIVTSTPISGPSAITATIAPAIRYGLLSNVADYAPLVAIEATGAVVTVTDDPAGYDVVAGYGVYEGWEPITGPPVALQLDTSLPPLDNAEIEAAVWDAIRPGGILDTLAIPGAEPLHTPTATNSRAQLANAGYPAGVTLYGRVILAPGVDLVLDQLADVGVQVTAVNSDTPRVHLTVGPLDTPDAQPLYSLPRSYTAPADTPLNFTEDGWPIPASTPGGNPR